MLVLWVVFSLVVDNVLSSFILEISKYLDIKVVLYFHMESLIPDLNFNSLASL